MRITKERKKLGLSQEAIARALGMSLRNWTRIETGEYNIKLKDAHQLWAFLVSRGMSEKIGVVDLFK
jgi:transcriptional regulator with XRE-family HTH domain